VSHAVKSLLQKSSDTMVKLAVQMNVNIITENCSHAGRHNCAQHWFQRARQAGKKSARTACALVLDKQKGSARTDARNELTVGSPARRVYKDPMPGASACSAISASTHVTHCCEHLCLLQAETTRHRMRLLDD
jgi:hypothetical protein